MGTDPSRTLANFLRHHDPQFVFVIPARDADRQPIDLTDADALGRLHRRGALEQIPFTAMNLRNLAEVDEQQDAGGLIVTAGASSYLIPYSPVQTQDSQTPPSATPGTNEGRAVQIPVRALLRLEAGAQVAADVGAPVWDVLTHFDTGYVQLLELQAQLARELAERHNLHYSATQIGDMLDRHPELCAQIQDKGEVEPHDVDWAAEVLGGPQAEAAKTPGGRQVFIPVRALQAMADWAGALAHVPEGTGGVLGAYVRGLKALSALEGDLIEELSRFYEITLTPQQMSAFLDRQPDLCQLIIQMDEVSTGEREQAINRLSQELTGRDWPLYADQEGPAFFAQFVAAAERAGYTVGQVAHNAHEQSA